MQVLGMECLDFLNHPHFPQQKRTYNKDNYEGNTHPFKFYLG